MCVILNSTNVPTLLNVFTLHLSGHVSSFNRFFKVLGLKSNSEASTCLPEYPLRVGAVEDNALLLLFPRKVSVGHLSSVLLINVSDKS